MTRRTIAVVAGSGLNLNGLLDTVDRELSFRDLASLPEAAVAGHDGRFLIGTCGDARLIIQCGRLHLYEGLRYDAVAATVDVLHRLGADTVVFTNAAGGLQAGMKPGELMAAERVRLWRYRGWPDAPRLLTPEIEVPGCDWRGAYHWVHGPCYETRAEIGALHTERSSAVGMSTAPEMHRAQALGLRTAAISCITNNCCTPQKLTHEHVLRTAAAASTRLCALLRGFIQIGAAVPRGAARAR